MMVTSEPNRRKACAISHPIGPAPNTRKRLGSSVREKTDSFVWKPASRSPSTGGTAARAPVAIAAFEKRSLFPPTSTASGPANRASPRKTSTPSEEKRRTESWPLMRARRRRIRSMTPGKSAPYPAGAFTPYRSASLISKTTREERIRHFDGTQPTLRQSPPSRCRSTNATLAPRPAAPAAVTSPAVPAPRTTRW